MEIINSKSELDQAAEVFARAFRDYPLYTYLFPDETTRAKLLPVLFKCSAKYVSEYAYHISENDNVQAVMLLDSPNVGHPSLKNTLELLINYGYKFPLKQSLKMISIFKEYEKAQPKKHFHYIQAIAVSPDHQGRGLGQKCIEFARSIANSETIYLETNSPDNVDYYTNSGFKLYRNFKCDKGHGPETWSFIETH